MIFPYLSIKRRDAIRSLPIVAIGVDESEDEVLACAEAGAAGYVTREGSLDELVASVQSAVTIATGTRHVSA